MLQNIRPLFVLTREKLIHANLRATILVFGLLMILLLWLAVYSKIESEKEQELRDHTLLAENYAREVEEHVIMTLQIADQTLLFLKYLYEKEGDTINIPRFVQAGTLLENPAFILMGIIDKNGEFIKSNQVPFVPSSLKDREHFTVHLHKNDEKLFISKPVLGRSSGKYSIQLTRRINAPDGSFNGVAVLTLSPDYFTNFYKTMMFGAQSSVTLLGFDSIIRSRQPNNETSLGQTLISSSLAQEFKSFIASDNIQLHLRFASPIDGLDKIVCTRKVYGYPLVVSVGLSVNEFLTDALARKKLFISIAGIVSVVVLIFILALYSMAEKQRESEIALLRERESLEEKVTQRTYDIAKAYENSKNQDKMASIGQLAAGIAHEINNPLNFISANIQALQNYYTFLRNSIDSSTGQICSNVNRNELQYVMQDLPGLMCDTTSGLNRMTEIITALRMFSRTEQTPTFETYNLNSGIQDALLLTRNELKFLAIIEENMLSLPQIPGIGSQINQVIVNLLLNAAYAIKKAGRHDGKIVIRSYPCENKVCCEIEDNGCGIPPQIAHSLFEPFFTTKPTGVGTGLGLSISYDIIVNKHGGSLSFESVEGKGSIFMFCLPMQHD